MQEEYTIMTIEELFNLVTSDNVERLIPDINNTLRHIAELKNNELENQHLKIKSFTWKDDGDIRSEVLTHPNIIENAAFKLCACTISTLNPYSVIPNKCLNCGGIISQ